MFDVVCSNVSQSALSAAPAGQTAEMQGKWEVIFVFLS